MSDANDLLAGAPVATTAPKKRGRPPKQRIAELAELAGAKVVRPEDLGSELTGKSVGSVVLDELAAEQVPADTAAPEVPPELAAGNAVSILDNLLGESGSQAVQDGLAKAVQEMTSVPEADGSVSLQLPPVSSEYALAIDNPNRIRQIGRGERDYAYKRLLRAGKKL